MSFLLGPGVTVLVGRFLQILFCDGPEDSRDAGLRKAVGNQGTICRAPRVRCGTAMITGSATAGARSN